MHDNHFTLGQISRLLGKKPHLITYAITSGHVPEPAMRIGNKRVFGEADLQTARPVLQHPDARSQSRRRRRCGATGAGPSPRGPVARRPVHGRAGGHVRPRGPGRQRAPCSAGPPTGPGR